MYGQSEGQYLVPQYDTLKPPKNYATLGAGMAGIGIAFAYLIILTPFCTMQRAGLLNYNTITGMLIEKLDISASLWDMHMYPTCGKNGIIGIDQVSVMLCQSMDGLWGHHLLLDMNSHACNLEESLRSTGLAQFVLPAGAWGCDKFNMMSIGALITITCLGTAALCHVTTALNVYSYYHTDTSPERRRWILVFGGAAPAAAVTGALAYGMLFDISHMVIPHTLRMPPGIIYPASWGTLFFATVLLLDVIVTLVIIGFLDKMSTEGENKKYEQYTSYSAVMQQQAMLQQQDAAIQQHYGPQDPYQQPSGYGYGPYGQ
jgi:hypothetical protein